MDMRDAVFAELKKRWWVLVLILLGAVLVQKFYVKKWVDEYTPPAYAARADEFLALERLLAGYGMQSQVKKDDLNALTLPDTRAVLFLPDGAENLSEQQSLQIDDWVARGGHLVIAAFAQYESIDSAEVNLKNDFIWQRWGIRMINYPSWLNLGLNVTVTERVNVLSDTAQASKDVSSVYQWYPSASRYDEMSADENNPSNSTTAPVVKTPSFDEYYGIQWIAPSGATTSLTHPISKRMGWRAPIVKINPEAPNTQPEDSLVQVQVDKGLVTVMNDIAWLRNDGVGAMDNAYLAWKVFAQPVAGHAAPTQLVIYPSLEPVQEPNVWRYLRAHIPLTVYSGIVLIVLALWRYRLISGPRLAAMAHTRQDLSEHLRAVGWFVFRADKGQFWLKNTQNQLHTSTEPVATQQSHDEFLTLSQQAQHSARTQWRQRLRRANPKHFDPSHRPSDKDSV